MTTPFSRNLPPRRPDLEPVLSEEEYLRQRLLAAHADRRSLPFDEPAYRESVRRRYAEVYGTAPARADPSGRPLPPQARTRRAAPDGSIPSSAPFDHRRPPRRPDAQPAPSTDEVLSQLLLPARNEPGYLRVDQPGYGDSVRQRYAEAHGLDSMRPHPNDQQLPAQTVPSPPTGIGANGSHADPHRTAAGPLDERDEGLDLVESVSSILDTILTHEGDVAAFLLDVLPGTGHVRSVISAWENAGYARHSFKDGDYGAAAVASLFTLIDIAGALPTLYGGAARRAAKESLERLPGIGRIIAQQRLARFDAYWKEKVDAHTVENLIGAHVWPDVEHQNSVRGVLHKAFGVSGEEAFALNARRAGFTGQYEIRNDAGTIVQRTNANGTINRHYDAILDQQMEKATFLTLKLVRPGRPGGTPVEVKANNARRKRSQTDFDNQAAGSPDLTIDGEPFTTNHVAAMRVPLKDLTPNQVLRPMRAALEAYGQNGRNVPFTQPQIEMIMAASERTLRSGDLRKDMMFGEFVGGMIRGANALVQDSMLEEELGLDAGDAAAPLDGGGATARQPAR